MKPGPIPTFVQNSRVGRTYFQIRERTLSVSSHVADSGFAESSFDLRTIDPDYKPQVLRLHTLLIIPGIAAVLSFFVVWGLMQIEALPRFAVIYFIQWPAIVFAVALALAIRGSRRIEYFVFRDYWKRDAFTIVCERAQREECAAFISTLVETIEVLQADIPVEQRAQELQRIGRESPTENAGRRRWAMWKLSITCGALVAGTPWIPGVGQYFYQELFVVFLALCVGGVALSYFSFDQREPGRWWSLLGAGLAIVPIFLYF